MSHVIHINELRHTYQWVVAHVSMSHVKRMGRSCHTHINGSSHTYWWVMAQVSISHVAQISLSPVTCTDESCHIYKSVMSHVWICYDTRIDQACQTYQWKFHLCINKSRHTFQSVTSHIPMSRIKNINEVLICKITLIEHACVMAQISLSHIARMNASCHAYQ